MKDAVWRFDKSKYSVLGGKKREYWSPKKPINFENSTKR
jgi:hypothetical protein